MKNKTMRNILVLLSIIVVLGCQDEPSTQTLYIYQNKSGVDVIINEISYPHYDSITIINQAMFTIIRNADGYDIQLPFVYDSVDVIFDKTKHKMYTWWDTLGRNPLHKDNYEKRQITKEKYEMYYTFTEQDYLDADSIK